MRSSAKTKQNTSSLLMLTSQLVSIGRFNEGLPSFISRGLDSEQIWQQLELRNEHSLSLPTLTKEIVKITTHSHKKHKRKRKDSSDETLDTDKYLENGEADSDSFSSEEESILKSIKEQLAEESSNDKQDALDIGRDDVDSDELDFDFALNNEIATGSSDDESDKKAKKKPANKPSEKRKTVDDTFFKLSEMEEFLEAKDLKEAKKIKQESRKKDTEEDDDDSDDSEEGEEIDMFANMDSEAENDPMYGDFFDPPENDGSEKKKTKTKDVKQTLNKDEDEINSSDSEDNDNEENGSYSSNDIETEKTLKKKVAFKDDLLQSDEETLSLSENKQKENKSTFELKQEQLLAKAREMEELSIKEVSWELLGEATASKRPENSLLETVLDFQHTNRAAPVITEETTKTLEDFITQRIKDKQEKNTVKADPECEKIGKELDKLFNHLDALSSFRFTPMQPGTEVKVIINTPAIIVEEVAPITTADADLLAPEEVLVKKKQNRRNSPHHQPGSSCKYKKKFRQEPRLRQFLKKIVNAAKKNCSEL